MKKPSGFSLVELLVVIAILGVLVGVALPSFNSWLSRLQVRNAAEALLNGMQLARTEAIKSNGTVNLTMTGGTAWTITDAAGTTIQSKPDAEGAQLAFFAITSPAVATPFVVHFSGLGRMTTAPEVAPAVAVSISASTTSGSACTSAGPSGCLVINVSLGGQIRMCDPSPSKASTPQAC